MSYFNLNQVWLYVWKSFINFRNINLVRSPLCTTSILVCHSCVQQCSKDGAVSAIGSNMSPSFDRYWKQLIESAFSTIESQLDEIQKVPKKIAPKIWAYRQKYSFQRFSIIAVYENGPQSTQLVYPILQEWIFCKKKKTPLEVC